MKFAVKNEQTEEGIVAYIIAAGAQFSFLVGKGKLRVATRPGAHFWVVERDETKFQIQLVVTPIPQNIATAGLSDEQVLAHHCRSEVEHQECNLHQKLLEDTVAWGRYPTGEPYTRWCTEMEVPAQEISSITACANTLHAGHIILYTVQGIGAGWSLEALRLKSLRVVMSTFRHGDLERPQTAR